jgi:hypothetical protein
MSEAKLLAELAICCRRIADHQHNPNVLDMLYDLEQDYIQRAKILEHKDRATYLFGTPTTNAVRRAP